MKSIHEILGICASYFLNQRAKTDQVNTANNSLNTPLLVTVIRAR